MRFCGPPCLVGYHGIIIAAGLRQQAAQQEPRRHYQGMIGVETAHRVMFVSLDAEKVGARPQERGAPGAKLLGGGLLLGSHKADISAAGAKDKEPRLFRGSERLLLEA
jgi:hypothetical protein